MNTRQHLRGLAADLAYLATAAAIGIALGNAVRADAIPARTGLPFTKDHAMPNMPMRPDFFDTQTLAIVRRKIGIRAANATLDSAMRQDLQCDSLDYIEVAHALEDGFGIELTDNDIETAETIGDYAATVRHRVAESYTLPPAQPTPSHPKRVLPCPITHDQLLAYNAETPA